MSSEVLFYSVRKAARLLGILPGDVWELCNEGKLESRFQGPVRTVSVSSVNSYAATLAGWS